MNHCDPAGEGYPPIDFDAINNTKERPEVHTDNAISMDNPDSENVLMNSKGTDQSHGHTNNEFDLSNGVDEFLMSRASTMSFGSNHPEDSFVLSATGLSSEESSINSRYLDPPPPQSRPEGTDETRRSNRPASRMDNNFHTKTRTSNLPRLTVKTRQTMALLSIDPLKDEERTSSRSSTPRTASTEPETPTGEFPDQSNTTPQFRMKGISGVSMSQSSSKDASQYQMRISNKRRHASYAEVEYWERVIIQHGHNTVQAAKGMENLGASLLRCRKFPEALAVYKRAVGVLRTHYGENTLIVAKGLDKIGLSASLCATSENLEWAYIALKEALHIRISYLGPHHCDCVDTLNNIAGVFLQKKEWSSALGIYLDVLTARSVIFGKYHPSIAITASTLGKIYHHLSEFHNALLHYNLALSIYKGRSMNLHSNHPLVAKVYKEMGTIERLMALEEESE